MLVLRTSRLRRTIVMTSIAGGVGALTWLHGIATAATAVVTPASMSSAESRVLSARIGELERRIVDLEALRAAAPAPVRAPFVVVDADGAVLMRVDRSAKTGFPRVTVGDTSGSAAVLVSTKEGGAVQLIDATNKVRLTALASPTRTGVTTFLRAGKAFMGGNDDGLPTFQARNLGEIPVAEIKALIAQNGQLVITNEAGDRLVVAGVATNGVGVIKMGPGGNGPAAVMGNIALPASEIQGKKK